MTIIDSTAEQDLLRLWSTIGELSEDLSRNRALSVALYNQVGNAKVRQTLVQVGGSFARGDDGPRIKPPILNQGLCCDGSIWTRRRVCPSIVLVDGARLTTQDHRGVRK